MGKIVTTSSKQKKGRSSAVAREASADHAPRQSISNKQGVPVHLKKGAEEVKTDHTTSCDDTTHEHANVIDKINKGALDQGQTLDATTQQEMTDQLDHEMSAVKVHTDHQAASLAESVNANAFTFGDEIVFNEGQYQPHTPAGKELLMHELTHVVQQRDAKRLQRQAKPQATPATQTKRDVVVIVGRPSMTLSKNETADEKEQMRAWRSAARALSPHVFEGLMVDKAFSGLKKFRHPIGKLYIIGHADSSGVGEIATDGSSVVTTVSDLTKRMRKATGALGSRKPDSVEMLACFGGGSPATMGKIGSTLEAASIRAPVQTTVISGRIIKLTSGGKTTVLNKRRIAAISDSTLISYIKQTDALKHYDFVPGVPHPETAPSNSAKLAVLVEVLRTTGMIPYVGYNAAPGDRYAVPYWKANIVQKKATEKVTSSEQLSVRGLIEVRLSASKSP